MEFSTEPEGRATVSSFRRFPVHLTVQRCRFTARKLERTRKRRRQSRRFLPFRAFRNGEAPRRSWKVLRHMYGHMCDDSRSRACRMHSSCPRPNIARAPFSSAPRLPRRALRIGRKKPASGVFSRAIRCFLWCQLSFTASRASSSSSSSSSFEMNGAPLEERCRVRVLSRRYLLLVFLAANRPGRVANRQSSNRVTYAEACDYRREREILWFQYPAAFNIDVIFARRI